MKREVQSIQLVLIGGTLLRLWISGSYLNFVKPGLAPCLVSAGAVLAILGVWGAFRDDSMWVGKSAHLDTEEMVSAEILDGHEHRCPKTAWLVLLPALTVFLVAPPPLGSFAASRGAMSVPKPPPAQLPALRGNPASLGVADFVVRAVWDDRKTLAGRRVRLTGFVTEAPGGAWYLTRMQITCCAADAEPFRIRAPGAPPFPADTWVRAVGHWVPEAGAQHDDAIPTLRVEGVVEIAQPAHPYE